MKRCLDRIWDTGLKRPTVEEKSTKVPLPQPYFVNDGVYNLLPVKEKELY